MTFLQTHKKTILISLAIGFLLAAMTRSSVIVFTTDLSYFRFFSIVYPAPKEFNFSSSGKQVIGLSGFPFTANTDCVMGPHGTIASPACEKRSWLGYLSIILNTLFWALLVFGIVSRFPESKKVIK